MERIKMSIAYVYAMDDKKLEFPILEADLILDEDHGIENEVADIPTESEKNISDNIRRKPYKITMTAFVTESPLKSRSSSGMLMTSNRPKYDNVEELPDAPSKADQTARKLNKAPQRIRDAFERLRTLAEGVVDGSGRRQYKILRVLTTLRVYDSMVIESVSVPKNSDTVHHAKFSVTFKEFNVVSSKSIAAANLAKNTTGPKKGTQTAAQPPRRMGQFNGHRMTNQHRRSMIEGQINNAAGYAYGEFHAF